MQSAMHVGMQKKEIGIGLVRARGRRKERPSRWAYAVDLVACENGLEMGLNWTKKWAWIMD